jgi:hypothetical protein
MLTVRTIRDAGAGRAETALRTVLPASIHLVVLASHRSMTSVKIAGRRLRLAWGGEGWRRDIDTVIGNSREKPDIVAARRISPGARLALDAAGIGWVDELGNAEIAIGSILVSRTGSVDAPSPRDPRWTPSVVAVTEALLLETPATVSEMQQATRLSTGSCTNALRTLTDLGLLDSAASRGRGSARRVVDPDALLNAYAAAAPKLSPSERVAVGVTWRDVINGTRDLGHQFDELGINWAATGAVAAALIAPLLTNVTTAVIYVNETTVPALAAAAARVGLKPIEGGRLTLRPFPTTAVQHLSTIVDDVHVAPWPRVYVDVRGAGVRGEEAAEHLREVAHAR